MFRLTHDTAIDPEFALELAVTTDILFSPCDDPPRAAVVFSALLVERPTEPVMRTLAVACARLVAAAEPVDPDTPMERVTYALTDCALTMAWGVTDEALLRRAQLLMGSIIDDGLATDEFIADADGADSIDYLFLLCQLATGMSAVLAAGNEEPIPSDPLRRVLDLVD